MMRYGHYDGSQTQALMQQALRQRMAAFIGAFPRENMHPQRKPGYPPKQMPPVMRIGPGFPPIRHAPQQPGTLRQYMPMPRY